MTLKVESLLFYEGDTHESIVKPQCVQNLHLQQGSMNTDKGKYTSSYRLILIDYVTSIWPYDPHNSGKLQGDYGKLRHFLLDSVTSCSFTFNHGSWSAILTQTWLPLLRICFLLLKFSPSTGRSTSSPRSIFSLHCTIYLLPRHCPERSSESPVTFSEFQ